MCWTFENSRELIVKLEDMAQHNGFHIGLTGGVLYKECPRKDLDIIVYSIRQYEKLDIKVVREVFRKCGVICLKEYGWMFKAVYDRKPIDVLIPETNNGIGGDYISNKDKQVNDLIILP